MINKNNEYFITVCTNDSYYARIMRVNWLVPGCALCLFKTLLYKWSQLVRLKDFLINTTQGVHS